MGSTCQENKMVDLKRPLFNPGKVCATPGALEALQQANQGVWVFLARHLAADWGEVDAHDKAANDQALKDGSRLLSAYTLSTRITIWLVTEAQDDNGQRAATTACLPSEY
jgi:hypothetical protein